jgi:hypothetical protein
MITYENPGCRVDTIEIVLYMQKCKNNNTIKSLHVYYLHIKYMCGKYLCANASENYNLICAMK